MFLIHSILRLELKKAELTTAGSEGSRTRTDGDYRVRTEEKVQGEEIKKHGQTHITLRLMSKGTSVLF